MIKGGGEVRDIRVAEGMRDRGHRVEFITGKPLTREVRFKIKNFETDYISSPWLRSLSDYVSSRLNIDLRLSGIIRRLDEHIFRRRVFTVLKQKEKSLDLVHLFGLGMAPLARKLEKSGIKSVLVLTTHSSVERYSKELKDISGIIAVGKTKEILPEGVDYLSISEPVSRNFRVINEKDKEIEYRDIKGAKKNILYVGRLVDQKRVIILLDALELIIKNDKNFRLLIVGDGPKKSKLKDKAKKKGIEDRVYLLGNIDNKKLHKIYNLSDVLVLPSKRESFSMVSVEALSCGTPVVATKVGILSDLIKNGKNGFILDKLTPHNLSEKIIKSTRSEDIKHYTERKSKSVREEFSAEKIISDLEKFLKKKIK